MGKGMPVEGHVVEVHDSVAPVGASPQGGYRFLRTRRKYSSPLPPRSGVSHAATDIFGWENRGFNSHQMRLG